MSDPLNKLDARLSLNDSQVEHFREYGYSEVFRYEPALDHQAMIDLYHRFEHVFVKGRFMHRRGELSETCQWNKSVFAIVPEFYDIATNPFIVEKVASILGENLICWGGSFIRRQPGHIHPWHLDTEVTTWGGVNVFIGLAGTSKESSLHILAHSHQLPLEPGLRFFDNREVEEYAKGQPIDTQIKTLAMTDGDFCIFNGRALHGSNNQSDQIRCALLFQYTTPDQAIRIKATKQTPEDWYEKAPVVLCKGSDAYGLNNLISRPSNSKPAIERKEFYAMEGARIAATGMSLQDYNDKKDREQEQRLMFRRRIRELKKSQSA